MFIKNRVPITSGRASNVSSMFLEVNVWYIILVENSLSRKMTLTLQKPTQMLTGIILIHTTQSLLLQIFQYWEKMFKLIFYNRVVITKISRCLSIFFCKYRWIWRFKSRTFLHIIFHFHDYGYVLIFFLFYIIYL